MELKLFVQAIQSGETSDIERWSAEARNVLVKYLLSRYGANIRDAEDCVQEVLLKVMDLIKEKKLEADSYGAYIVTMTRNEYIRIMKEDARTTGNYFLEEHCYAADYDPAEQLVNTEMLEFLQDCIDQLGEKSRELIEYFLKHPNARYIDIAQALGVSASTIWTRRHRVYKYLVKCISNKI